MIRQLNNNCNTNKSHYFCEFQVLTFRLNKLKKKLKKTDKHICHLTTRIAFVLDKINRGIYVNLIGKLVTRHKTYSDQKKEFLKKMIALKNEIDQIQILVSHKNQCKCCFLCKLT